MKINTGLLAAADAHDKSIEIYKKYQNLKNQSTSKEDHFILNQESISEQDYELAYQCKICLKRF